MESLEEFSHDLFQSLDAESPFFRALSQNLAEKHDLNREKMMKALIIACFKSALSGETPEQFRARNKAQVLADARFHEFNL